MKYLPIFILFLGYACTNGPGKEFDSGVEALKQERYELADSIFTSVLDKNPDNADALNNRAFALLRLGRDGDALKDADRAIELKPDNAIYRITRGEVHYQLGNLTEALNDANIATEKEPRNADAWYFLSSVRLAEGDTHGAMNAVRKALEYAPGMLLARQQAVVIHIRMERYDKAEYEAGKMVQEGIRDEFALNNRGYARLMQEKYPEAINDFEAALSLNPVNSNVLNNLGWAYFRAGNSEQALEFIASALESNPGNTDAWRNMALIYLDRGDTQNACKAFSELQKAMAGPGPPIYLNDADEVDRLWKLHCI
jgi:tetratricopeptide (TPR) repeat protein